MARKLVSSQKNSVIDAKRLGAINGYFGMAPPSGKGFQKTNYERRRRVLGLLLGHPSFRGVRFLTINLSMIKDVAPFNL